jgi:hypothetical protein
MDTWIVSRNGSSLGSLDAAIVHADTSIQKREPATMSSEAEHTSIGIIFTPAREKPRDIVGEPRASFETLG